MSFMAKLDVLPEKGYGDTVPTLAHTNEVQACILARANDIVEVTPGLIEEVNIPELLHMFPRRQGTQRRPQLP